MTSVLVPLADRFEELEAVSIIDLLRRANIAVTTAAISGGGLDVKGSHDITIRADARFSEVKDRDFDAVVLPGGPAYLTLLEHKELHAVVRRHADAGRLVAAICAAPAVLARLGLLNGRRAACYPSVEGDLRAAGATLSHDAVAVDGRLITSRGPSTAPAFAIALINALAGADVASKIASDILIAP